MDNDNDEIVTTQYYAAKESLDAMSISTSIDVSVNKYAAGSEKIKRRMDDVAESESMTWKEWAYKIRSMTWKDWKEFLIHIYKEESLLVEVLLAVALARVYPPLGAKFLYPEVTAHWVAVIVIFFLSGFALRIEQLSSAASNWKFNSFVICYNFIFQSLVMDYVAKFFYQNEIVSEDLMKGMIICSCLSMPTNMMVVLCISANGDEAVALFLATIMNLMGVFVTPLLIFFYLKEAADIDFIKTYKTISLRVLLPVILGILFRMKIGGAEEFANENKKLFLKIRERSLVYVVYATFCQTFLEKTDSTRSQILLMALAQIILLVAAMSIAWVLLFIFFNREPKLRVVGLFGCSTKTAALGIPLISALYEDNPKLGIYTLPLLVWYPSQLIIGTMLGSRLRRFVDYKLNKYMMEDGNDIKVCGLMDSPLSRGEEG